MDMDRILITVGVGIILFISVMSVYDDARHKNEVGMCTKEGYTLFDGSKLKSDGTTYSRNYQIAMVDSLNNGDTVN